MRSSWLALVSMLALSLSLPAQQSPQNAPQAPPVPATQPLDLRNPLDNLLLQWEEKMKAMSLKIREDILEEMDKTVREIKMSRNAYINKAVEFYTKVLGF